MATFDSLSLRAVPQVVEALEKTRALLADVELDIDIPSIVVLGDQGTGKSSLLSAIIGMELPTGQGTTTRAPLKISIKPAPLETSEPSESIEPGAGSNLTLTYPVYHAAPNLPTGIKKEHKQVNLSASDLQRSAGLLSAHILDAQNEMKATLDQLRGGDQYIVGDGAKAHWLLKDSIDLSVEVANAKGSFTVVDLPGFHQPDQGPNARLFTEQIKEFILEKIRPRNTVILSLVKAEQAVSASSTNLSGAAALVNDVDPERNRTLPIYSMADRVERAQDYAVLLETAADKSKKHGCVLVATNPSGGPMPKYKQLVESEAAVLARYKSPPTSDAWNDEEKQRQHTIWKQSSDSFKKCGGFGVPFLMEKLVKLQADMVNQQLPVVLAQIQKEARRLAQELKAFSNLPESDEEASRTIQDLLGKAVERFKSACNNTALVADGDSMSHTMLDRIKDAAVRYGAKQDEFIPGIIGRRKAVDLIVENARRDQAANLPIELSEFISRNLYNEFCRHATVEAQGFIEAVKVEVQKTLVFILGLFLKSHEGLKNIAIEKAVDQLEDKMAGLKAAVEDIVTAYSRMAEPLHDKVLFLTYHQLLLLASGILLNAEEEERYKMVQAAATELDGDAVVFDGKAAAVKAANGTQDDDAVSKKFHSATQQAKGAATNGARAEKGVDGVLAGRSQAVAAAIGGLVAAGTAPVIGPFAVPVGFIAGEVSAIVWELSKVLFCKYKERYHKKLAERKQAAADASTSGTASGSGASQGQNKTVSSEIPLDSDLLWMPWPDRTDPMTSFELLCKIMNCDPGFVVVAMEHHYNGFKQAVGKEKETKYKYDEVDLQKIFIGALCRIICSHHAMTESVSKLVRLRLLSVYHEDENSLPYNLGLVLARAIESAAKESCASLTSYFTDEQTARTVARLKQQCQAADQSVKLLEPFRRD